MRAPVIAMFAVVLFVLAGCGGSSNNNSQTLSIQSGNWNINATSTAAQGFPFDIGGSLSQSGNSITGVVHVFSDAFCFTGDIPLSGTVSGQTVTLTSPVVDGEVLTVNATSSSSTTLSGTYTVAVSGTNCIGGGNDQGAFTASLVPSISGTWHGTFVSASTQGTTINVTANITQSPAPDAHGMFPLSGTLSFSGSPCFTSGTIESMPVASTIAGDVLTLALSTNDQPTPGLTTFGATVHLSATFMSGEYVVRSGNCAADFGTGSMTRP